MANEILLLCQKHFISGGTITGDLLFCLSVVGGELQHKVGWVHVAFP